MIESQANKFLCKLIEDLEPNVPWKLLDLIGYQNFETLNNPNHQIISQQPKSKFNIF